MHIPNPSPNKQDKLINEINMAKATERVPVLVTLKEKQQIALKAKSIGISVGELMRRATTAYKPTENEKLFESMMFNMNEATDKAEIMIDESIDFIKQSQLRIAQLESDAKNKQKRK